MRWRPRRMAGPVIAATMTRVAAFSPLLFWPGIVGDFMKYLPITLIVTLSASMLYALVFTPTLGAIFGKAHHEPEHNATAPTWPSSRQAVRFPDHRRCCSPSALLVGRSVRLFANTAPASSSSPMSSRTTACFTCMRAATCRSPKWTPPRRWRRTAFSAGRA